MISKRMRFANNDFQALTNLSGRLCHTRLGLTIEGRNQIIECISQLRSKIFMALADLLLPQTAQRVQLEQEAETSAMEIPAIQE
jgi:hypothetical protein